jgi:hypothetical protein
MTSYYTYAHTRNDTGKIFYIGKGKESRHLAVARRNAHWTNIANKYGFQAEILAHWSTEQEALDHEILLISCFRDMGYDLANYTDGGEGLSGIKHSEETKQKISKAHLGRPKDPVAVAKSAAAHKGIVNMKVLEKLWELNRGRKRSQETIDKMKAAWVIRKAKKDAN